MIEELRKIIENGEIVDIYMNPVVNNESDIVYHAFNVVDLDTKSSLFRGFTEDERAKPEGERILTEDSIALINRIRRP